MSNKSLHSSLRYLWHHKSSSLLNIVCLAVGMAAAILINIWVFNELSFDETQPHAADLYRIKTSVAVSPTSTWRLENSQYVLGEHISKEIPEITTVARLLPNTYGGIGLGFDGKLFAEKKSAYVDDGWFNLFHYEFVYGSAEGFNSDPFSLVMTLSAARNYFGNADVVGKVVRVDTTNYVIKGIVKDNPVNSSLDYNVLLHNSGRFSDPEVRSNELDWGTLDYMTFLQLRKGADTNRVSARLNDILRQNSKDHNNMKYSLINVRDMHFEADLTSPAFAHGNKRTVNIFIILASLILVTACINYVNLTTARTGMRTKEVGIRKIVGAGRWILFRRFMLESLILSALSLILALGLVEVCLPWFRSFTGEQFPQPLLSAQMWGIAGLTLGIAFLANGLYPALMLSALDPMQMFRGIGVFRFRRTVLKKLLVVVQFAISIILIVSTVVIYRQLNFLQEKDSGYDRTMVFSLTIPSSVLMLNMARKVSLLETIKQKMLLQGGVSGVSLASSRLIDFKNQSSGSFDWDGRPRDFDPKVAPFQADKDFLSMMGLKIQEGRWFGDNLLDKHNVLLNETAVRMLNIKGPVINQRFVHQRDTGVIIGVVSDFHYRSLHEKVGPMVIADQPGRASGIYVKVRQGHAVAAVNAVQRVWHAYLPDDPFTYEFLDESYSNLYKAEQQTSVLITVFAGIALFIAGLGLLGLSALMAEQKTKEVGIRKVLGANVFQIMYLLSQDFMKMILVAGVFAFPIAWWFMHKWLENYAYRIDLSWWIFAFSAGIALVISMVIVGTQSIKVAVSNPVTSLRVE